MKIVIVLLAVVFNLIFASSLDLCQQNSTYGRSLEDLIQDPTYILNFDDQEWTNEIQTTLSTPLVIESNGISFTISGENCQIQSKATNFDESTSWDGNNIWNGLDIGSVGYFLTATTNTSICTIEFAAPISEIYFYAMCGAAGTCTIAIYDAEDKEINCRTIANSPGLNTFVGWGMTGYKQIAKLVFSGGLGGIDEIQVRQGCGTGSWWNQGQCEVFDACNLNYCDYNANCTSYGSDVMSPLCTCLDGFYGDGYTCDNVNECEPESGISPCPNNTVCSNTTPGFSCYCDGAGFIFEIGGADLVCQDIDECNPVTDGPDVCVPEATCHNFYGGYECICTKGFVGDGSAFTAVGCTFYMCLNESVCHKFATCGSDDGVTLKCTCPEGFPGDGVGPDGCGPKTPETAPNSNPNSDSAPQSDNNAPRGVVSLGVRSVGEIVAVTTTLVLCTFL